MTIRRTHTSRVTILAASNALLLMIGAPASLSGCSSESAWSETIGQQQDPLWHNYYAYSGVWPRYTPINVCWDAATITSTTVSWRDTVRDWVLNEIARHADLRLVGWGACATSNPPSDTIRLWADHVEDPSHAAGRMNNTCSWVSFHNDSRRTDSWVAKAVVLHEFMHALGFDHEWERNESAWDPAGADHYCSPHSPPDLKVGSGDLTWSAYDGYSILNFGYCWTPDVDHVNPGNPMANREPRLSPLDIVGLQRVYGRKPWYSIAGKNNYCIDIDNPALSTPTSATRLQAWDCVQNTANQAWRYNTERNRLYAHWHSAGSFNTMDVQWGDTTDSTPLWNWTANDTDAQKWYFLGIALVGMGGLCLDVPGNNRFAGQTVQLFECNGTEAQQWRIFHGAEGRAVIGSAMSHYCLQSNLTPGDSALTLQRCSSSSPAQSFSIQDTQIRQPVPGSVGQCFDVDNAVAAPYTRVKMYECRDSGDRLPQQWYIRGRIVGDSGKCVDMDGSDGRAPQNGTEIHLWSCNKTPAQTWDFHF